MQRRAHVEQHAPPSFQELLQSIADTVREILHARGALFRGRNGRRGRHSAYQSLESRSEPARERGPGSAAGQLAPRGCSRAAGHVACLMMNCLRADPSSRDFTRGPRRDWCRAEGWLQRPGETVRAISWIYSTPGTSGPPSRMTQSLTRSSALMVTWEERYCQAASKC